MVGLSDYTVLILDTTAPVVTWGAPSDAINSETFTVPYVVDEPQVESADIRLADGRVVALDVEVDRITGDLPDDAVEGWATVRASVVDDVGNRAVRTLAVYVTGVPAQQPPTPVGQSYPPSAPIDRVTSEPSRVRATARYTVRVLVTTSTTGAVRARYTAPTRRAMTMTSGTQPVIVWRHYAHAPVTIARARGSAVDAVQKRPEGPDAEDELLLLNLL